MKLLILSDIHYPQPYSMLYKEIIKREKPDNLVILGDAVEPTSEREILSLQKRFIKELSSAFPLDKVVYLVGDNDYEGNKEVLRFLSGVGFMNHNSFTYGKGNMFFFHGNVELGIAKGNMGKSHTYEDIGQKSMRALGPFLHWGAPKLVNMIARRHYRIKSDTYLFLGHLHLMRRLGDRTVFCGTLRNKRIVYDLKEALGYVTVKHRNFVVASSDDIKLNKLKDVKIPIV